MGGGSVLPVLPVLPVLVNPVQFLYLNFKIEVLAQYLRDSVGENGEPRLVENLAQDLKKLQAGDSTQLEHELRRNGCSCCIREDEHGFTRLRWAYGAAMHDERQ